MRPFDEYRDGGEKLLGKPEGVSTRHGYGSHLHAITKQTRCAYCEVDLTADYYRWLLLTRDHVVPERVARKLNIPKEFWQDCINLVLACSGCNGFANRWGGKPLDLPEFKRIEPRGEWTLKEFLKLRDRVFQDRSRRIAERRRIEMRVFDQKPWAVKEEPPGPKR